MSEKDDAFAEAVRRQTDAAIFAMQRQVAESWTFAAWWSALPWWKKLLYRLNDLFRGGRQ